MQKKAAEVYNIYVNTKTDKTQTILFTKTDACGWSKEETYLLLDSLQLVDLPLHQHLLLLPVQLQLHPLPLQLLLQTELPQLPQLHPLPPHLQPLPTLPVQPFLLCRPLGVSPAPRVATCGRARVWGGPGCASACAVGPGGPRAP